ncbi:hypothetical protein V8E55_004119, partial [Tylopilus felleus]
SKSHSKPIDKEYTAAARAVACCVDIFCHPRKVIDFVVLLKEEEAVEKGDLEDQFHVHISSVSMSKLPFSPPKQQARYRCTYDMFIELAPALKELVNNPKKLDELRNVLSGMKRIITCVRSDDCARLKERVGHYVPANPGRDIISPPIHDVQSSRSHLGFNHPVLTQFLCPIEHVKDFNENPDGYGLTRQKLVNGRIKVTSDMFPAFLWAGEPPRVNFNEENMLEGMFEGYFLTCVSQISDCLISWFIH